MPCPISRLCWANRKLYWWSFARRGWPASSLLSIPLRNKFLFSSWMKWQTFLTWIMSNPKKNRQQLQMTRRSIYRTKEIWLGRQSEAYYTSVCLRSYISVCSIDLFIGPESDHWLCLSVTNSLTDSLTDSVTFSKLDWCNPGVWRCQLKTCWCCNRCWWGSCWQQFVADFRGEVW